MSTHTVGNSFPSMRPSTVDPTSTSSRRTWPAPLPATRSSRSGTSTVAVPLARSKLLKTRTSTSPHLSRSNFPLGPEILAWRATPMSAHTVLRRLFASVPVTFWPTSKSLNGSSATGFAGALATGFAGAPASPVGGPALPPRGDVWRGAPGASRGFCGRAASRLALKRASSVEILWHSRKSSADLAARSSPSSSTMRRSVS
mmetsp:Transcript_60318/g.156563  ORF Transcript_60318/g.156563 Transcript_60318/m.156563 type:complete len:201 (-) Transcript_60318:141-743(-)